MADSPSQPPDIGGASAAKVNNELLRSERRQKKLERLRKEAKAVERKALAKKRAVEVEARKKARNAKTMRSYFGSSRNSENRNVLQCAATAVAGEVGGSTSVPVLNNDASGSKLVDTEILLSCPDIVPISDAELSPELESDGELQPSKAIRPHKIICSESEPNISGDEMVDSDNDFMDLPGSLKKRKGEQLKPKGAKEGSVSNGRKKYDLYRKFQSEWAAKQPWSEAVLTKDGIMHMVQCKVCTTVRGKPIQMAPKWDTISKHATREIHRKCLLLYAARGPATVIGQIQGCTNLESKKKRAQFATLFQLLSSGRPMIELEARFELYQFVNVPYMPLKHWSDNSGWIMAEHMYDFVKKRIQSLVSTASYLAVTADETSACDNTSWIAIHGYVVVNWSCVPLLLTIQKMDSDGASANKLTTLIMDVLSAAGGVTNLEISEKLLCFGANGVSAFQGVKNGVTTQIKDKFSPFCTGVHCCAHRLNLAAQSLSTLPVMHAVEEVLRMTHAYFSHSPKKAAEFKALSQQLSSKGLKLLKNVKTCWMSCLNPIRRLLAEYKGVMAMMHNDKSDKKWGLKARANLALLLDPYVLLGMLALLPMLEAVDTLIQWAQKRDVYICGSSCHLPK